MLLKNALFKTLVLVFILLVAGCQNGSASENGETAVSPTQTPTTSNQSSEPNPTEPASTAPVSEPESATPIPTQAAGGETAVSPSAIDTSTYPPRDGALIQVSMNSQVGILLDEIPESDRERIVDILLAQPDEAWLARAHRQVRLTQYRLNFRNFFYFGKGQLPLPPRDQWQLELTGDPIRQTVQNHDLLIIPYRFSGTLLTDIDSPAEAEPRLADIGGVWEEPFVLPLDPELLLQRTGNSCIDEAGFPPNSYDSENVSTFYDHECTPDSVGPEGCHRTERPSLSCLQAIDAKIGRVETTMNFERLPWNDTLADTVRSGPLTSPDTPDLAVVTSDLADNRIIYRYFAPDACGVLEQCVGGSGWRRLLQFSGTVHNVGGETLHIGPVVAEDPLTNLFSYNSCHDHFHFSNYGDFIFGSTNQESKQAFCVESTNRFSNNEFSPLTHPYSCTFQGIQAGWADEYGAGLDCQWIDITELPELQDATDLVSVPLTFTSNTDSFLCEGEPVLDDDGNPVWEVSGFTTADGAPISYPQCSFTEGYQANNSGSLDIPVRPQGGFVTQPCQHGELGPLRNCGFTKIDDTFTCDPGTQVQLSCSLPADAAPHALRVCETSTVLGTGLDCVEADALANVTLSATSQLSFTCPLPRDADESGGGYALYAAPVFTDNKQQPISCSTP
ncbi:MAG: lysyl oxidase family protein [Chloroflexota bacterium]